jgi:hypothetical protein
MDIKEFATNPSSIKIIDCSLEIILNEAKKSLSIEDISIQLRKNFTSFEQYG